MRTIEKSGPFKRDFKRESKGQYRSILINELNAIVFKLANDKVLSEKYRDHALSGQWKHHRECHIKPDLLLIYRKTDNDMLILERIGSHSELF